MPKRGEYKANKCDIIEVVPRTCKVSITDVEGMTHSLTVSASTLFEAATAALKLFRHEEWALGALTPNAVLEVEVQLPPIVHDVPLKAVERWLQSPGSPKDQAIKHRMR